MNNLPPASPIATHATSSLWHSPRWWFGLLLVYWLSLFIATHWPSDIPALAGGILDKFCHFAAFGILTALMGYTVHAHGFVLDWRTLFILGVLAAAYGAVDEWLQPPVGRSCEFYDWLADLAGGTAGLAFVKVWTSPRSDATALRPTP